VVQGSQRGLDRDLRTGLQLSLLVHCSALAAALGFVSVPTFQEPEVYSVTVEAGAVLGGAMQAPPEKEEQKQVPVAKSAAQEIPEPEVEKRDAVEQLPVIASPEDLIVLAPTPIPTKKPQATPKPTAVPTNRPTPKPTQKAVTTPKKSAPKEPTLEEINRELALATRKYTGESANAGGEGFGAARVGGRGMGGGVLIPREVMEYLRTLEGRVKQGWRWFDPKAALRASVVFQISPTGEISEVVVSQSSGNSAFDDSVVRAIRKANPLPVPPPAAYEHLRDGGGARVTFDPRQL
jgi:TonB family protein